VLPFLQGETITARVDLKSDRQAKVLLIQAAHAEADARPDTAEALAAELTRMAGWLGLERVQAVRKGDLSEPLAQALSKM
jgi:uncharacterized protein YcaQ